MPFEATFRVNLRDPTMVLDTYRVIIDSVKRLACSVIEEPAWLLAVCGHVMVKVWINSEPSITPALQVPHIMLKFESEHPVQLFEVASRVLNEIKMEGVTGLTMS